MLMICAATQLKELSQIIKRLAKVIDTYALEYNKGALSNGTAKKLLDEALAIELAEVKLKQSYISKFGKVLPMTEVARYIQIETKIRAVLYFRLADKIPLVEWVTNIRCNWFWVGKVWILCLKKMCINYHVCPPSTQSERSRLHGSSEIFVFYLGC